MAKLTRFTQLIFGSNASAGQIAQVGSLAAGTPTTYSGSTATPSLVQQLSNYLTGWFGVSVGSNSPAEEDMNALFWLVTYQLAYLMQEGAAEYDSGTTYYIGSVVNNGSGTLYTSIANSNIGNALTNPTYWAQPVQNGSVTPNTLPSSTTIATGNTLMWPNLVVPTGDTLTIATGSNYIGFTNLTLQGTAVLILQGTAVAKII